MSLYTKNLGMIICCIYCFVKLLKLPMQKKELVQLCLCALLFPCITVYSDLYFPTYSAFITILLLSISLYLITNTPLFSLVTTTCLSFAMSYSFMLIASIFVSIIIIPVVHSKSLIWAQLGCCILQLTIMHIPFRIKRLKNGMPFLKQPNYAIPGMFISLAVIFISIIINNITFQRFSIIIVIALLVAVLLIYYYWRSNITKTYLDKINERNVIDLTETIALQAKEIEALKQDNDRLGKIIHKDNKLIPAMEYAVRSYITNNSVTNSDTIAKGEQLLEELNRLSEERKGILHKQDMRCQQLASTKLTSVDNLLAYMQQKANNHDIELQANISCDMQYLIEHIVTEEELNTLLADLLENALIATKHNKGHRLLLSISVISKAYTISVFDSGIPFTLDVLVKWGLEQITTHKNDGGSGIGMMTTYELLKKYNASFIIHEFGTDKHTYTKQVTVSFNKMNQYILQTRRPAEELARLSKRTNLKIKQQ